MDASRLARHVAESDRLTPRRVAAGLAVLAGVFAVLISTVVFPYRSINHDEGVYLQQAAMLLEGQLTIDPPVDGSLRPWFFVAGDGGLYPKYAPVPAAIFAVGRALGEATLALGAVAAATVALTYATVTEAFEPRVGVVAAALLLATPLFLVQASVFLGYLPTLALLLAFAWAYLRADRTGDHRWAALAGAAVGLAFFARPFTAVLFAAPFVCHALWTTWVGGRPAIRRQLVTAALGLAGVATALGYNWLMTGAPLRFPYQVFGPRDGPGFGTRALLGHEVVYDLELAVESAGVALSTYVFRWSVAAPLGVLLAAIGLGLVLRRRRSVEPRALVLAGLFASIPIGQLAFWGTYNAIGRLDAPGFGLIGHLGPFYHLGLILPTAAFAALALVRGGEWLWPRLVDLDSRSAKAGAFAALVVAGGLGGVLAATAVADPVEQNLAVTDEYETAYEPIEAAGFDRALVFLPTPYGDWLAHPFQYLRNDPDFDGDVIYAQDRRVFAVVEALPDRTLYRYAYRGDWFAPDGDPVTPTLRRLEHVAGERVRLETRAGVPPETVAVAATLETGSGRRVAVPLDPSDGAVHLSLLVDGDVARLEAPDGSAVQTVPVSRNETLDLTVYVDTGGLDSFEYDLELPVRNENGTVRAITPRMGLCRAADQCDDGAAYVPGAHGPDVELETHLEATDS